MRFRRRTAPPVSVPWAGNCKGRGLTSKLLCVPATRFIGYTSFVMMLIFVAVLLLLMPLLQQPPKTAGLDDDHRYQMLEDDPRYFPGAVLGKAHSCGFGNSARIQ